MILKGFNKKHFSSNDILFTSQDLSFPVLEAFNHTVSCLFAGIPMLARALSAVRSLGSLIGWAVNCSW